MPRRVYVQRTTERFDLVERPAPSEYSLQEVIKSNPRLIPSDDLGLDGDLLVVGRETTLASGAIDLLCLARSGDLVLIEFKTGPQNPDFRHALAQVIDYGSDLWRLAVDDFDRGIVQRYLNGPNCDTAFKDTKDLSEAIEKSNWELTDDERASLDSRLGEVLQSGDFIYVIAAQRFTPGMTTSLEYLNATMRRGRFFLVEVVRMEGSDLVAHLAQVVAAPSHKAVGGTGAAAGTVFTDQISDPAFRDLVDDILATARSLGLKLETGPSGGSIRLQTPDRQEPLSVGWAFRDGGQWYGARSLTLGVDPASLKKTPSVSAAVAAYVELIRSIPGAIPAKGSLDAYIFDATTGPPAREAMTKALESLVSAASGVSAAGST